MGTDDDRSRAALLCKSVEQSRNFARRTHYIELVSKKRGWFPLFLEKVQIADYRE
ncbi:MAG: hypothetical protein IJU03_13335 [Thermoguttaceae bacterium]|nr:hypothetical protein [Thermoguttaceae bacterium]